MLRERGYDCFTILAQSAPGMNLVQVEAELALIAKGIRDWDPRANRKLEFQAQSYSKTVTGQVREVFLGLVAALGLVLLIVCANVANLLIARAVCGSPA